MRIEERFWEKVDRSGGPEFCWLWTAGKFGNGYGKFTPKHGIAVSAHQFSYKLAHGTVPPGSCVLHRCDNPACVNPKHLFVGTNADNMKDRDAKGRQARGSRNGCAKLSETEVAEIRRLSALGLTQDALAEQFGVSQVNVSLIVRNKHWRHI